VWFAVLVGICVVNKKEKRMKKYLAIGVVVFFGELSQADVILSPYQDGNIIVAADSSATANSSNASMWVGDTALSNATYVALGFDVNTSAADILNAEKVELKLTVMSVQGTVPEFQLVRVFSNTKGFGAGVVSQGASVIESVTIAPSAGEVLIFDVTAEAKSAVQAQVDNVEDQDYGLLFRIDPLTLDNEDGNQWDVVTFYSSEASDESYRPTLVVTAVPEVGTISLLMIGGASLLVVVRKFSR
jgi:hypothetical protein